MPKDLKRFYEEAIYRTQLKLMKLKSKDDKRYKIYTEVIKEMEKQLTNLEKYA